MLSNTSLLKVLLMNQLTHTKLETNHAKFKEEPSKSPNTLMLPQETATHCKMPLTVNQSLSESMLKPGNSTLEVFSPTVELPSITES
jgi:hypothetical protein